MPTTASEPTPSCKRTSFSSPTIPTTFAASFRFSPPPTGALLAPPALSSNGFQNSSALPPKASIARIVTAPDLFSTEYDTPPYAGGRVEIYTKPGASKIHGALFLTDSEGPFNANDPFSTVATPAGRRRYGFELSGPITKTRSDFFIALEKRDINEFTIVNAITLDANANQTAFHQTLSAPQRLWIASARADWQATPSEVVTASFAANTNNLTNQGIGGLVLPSAGYDSTVSEYDLRFTNTQTVSINLLHETHAAFTWKDTAQSPLSIAPGLTVAGFFLGGGSTAQNLNDRERNLEVDDVSEQGSGLSPVPAPLPILMYREQGGLAGQGTALQIGGVTSAADVWKEIAQPPYFVPYRGALSTGVHILAFAPGDTTWKSAAGSLTNSAGNSLVLATAGADTTLTDNSLGISESIAGSPGSIARATFAPTGVKGNHSVSLQFSPALAPGSQSSFDVIVGKKTKIAAGSVQQSSGLAVADTRSFTTPDSVKNLTAKATASLQP